MSTMVPMVIAILVVIGCSFYYYKKVNSSKTGQKKQQKGNGQNKHESDATQHQIEPEMTEKPAQSPTPSLSPQTVSPDCDHEQQRLQHEKEELSKKLQLKEQKLREMELFCIDYTVRTMTVSDYAQFLEICDRYSNEEFVNLLNNDKCVVYGCECKKTNAIIASALIRITDGGYTAHICQINIDSSHRHKNVESILTQNAMNACYSRHSCVSRYRYVLANHIRNRTNYDALKDKIGFQILNELKMAYLCLESQKHLQIFQQKLDGIHKEYSNKLDSFYTQYLSNFEQLKCRDIDNIVCILVNYYTQSDILIQWNIFDLALNLSDSSEESESERSEIEQKQSETIELLENESMDNSEDLYSNEEEEDMSSDNCEELNETNQIRESESEQTNFDESNSDKRGDTDVSIRSITDFKSYLFDGMSSADLCVFAVNAHDMNQENGALCFQCTDIVDAKCSAYHIFGRNETAILSMIYSCYYLWKTSVFDKGNGGESVRMFVNGNVVCDDGNDKLKGLFDGHRNEVYILEKSVQEMEIEEHGAS